LSSSEIPTAEEILALLEKFPKTKDYANKEKEWIVSNLLWFENFKPKLEAFMEDSVSRAQIQKLIEEFPSNKVCYKKEYVRRAKERKEWFRRLGAVLQK